MCLSTARRHFDAATPGNAIALTAAIFFINGAAAIRQGEETQCQNCGQSGEIEGGSSDVFIG